MDAKLISLWDRGVHFDYEGDPSRSREQISNDEVRGLNFSGSEVRDVDIESILPLHNLSGISFWNTAISDSALKLVARLPRLTDLNLCGTRVTDESVDTLLEMPSLEYLDVADTGISPSGIGRLKAGLPHTEIRC
jgi:hypothetical protein